MESTARKGKFATKKRKFVADGVFQAELNEFLTRTLGRYGYAGIEVRINNVGTEIRIRASKAEDIMKGQKKIREIKSLIEKRFNYSEANKFDIRIVPLPATALCAAWQAENIKAKLLQGTPVRQFFPKFSTTCINSDLNTGISVPSEGSCKELVNLSKMESTARKGKFATKKRKFVADGVFQAELNEFLTRTLGRYGYAGIEVRINNVGTEIRIRASKAEDIMKGQKKIREIKSLIEKRFNYSEANKFDIRIVPLPATALCAAWQAENIKAKLLQGTPVRLVVSQVLNNVKRTNIAKGVEVIISGKVRGQRAKAQKYKWGYLVTTGQPKHDFIDEAIRHVELRQGVLGIKVKIFVDNQGRKKDGKMLPDYVKIHEQKEDMFKTGQKPTAENIKAKLLQGTPVRLVVSQVLNNVKRTNIAKGVEVIISGKVRGQRAKAQKYKWGYLVTTGQPKHDFIDEAIRHVELRQGVLGIKVKIFVDNQGRKKDGKMLPDYV
eukprot:CAMPEP_0197016664 /NCGR_PEP_ID=MMETSP1380-20130617/79096_1 /TAXON_ID=5936 /ORGANISM="Euplotes crassus, Strain CT5" /LENGTH=493 /DNA_ID=CAMNT_0042443641 /DNA_START=33 /DNA_END=1511 /DNA_ORIENTATION=+